MNFDDELEECKLIVDDVTLNFDKKNVELQTFFNKMLADRQYVNSIKNDMNSKEHILKKHYDEVKRIRDELLNTVADTKEKLTSLNDEINEKSQELKELKRECEKQTKLCNSLRKHAEPSLKDKETLNRARTKLQLYQELTNIKWDYSVPEKFSATGYVRNKLKSYCQPFDFKKSNEQLLAETVEKLWKEIELGAQEDWPTPPSSDANKENLMSENTACAQQDTNIVK